MYMYTHVYMYIQVYIYIYIHVHVYMFTVKPAAYCQSNFISCYIYLFRHSEVAALGTCIYFFTCYYGAPPLVGQHQFSTLMWCGLVSFKLGKR